MVKRIFVRSVHSALLMGVFGAGAMQYDDTAVSDLKANLEYYNLFNQELAPCGDFLSLPRSSSDKLQRIIQLMDFARILQAQHVLMLEFTRYINCSAERIWLMAECEDYKNSGLFSTVGDESVRVNMPVTPEVVSVYLYLNSALKNHVAHADMLKTIRDLKKGLQSDQLKLFILVVQKVLSDEYCKASGVIVSRSIDQLSAKFEEKIELADVLRGYIYPLISITYQRAKYLLATRVGNCSGDRGAVERAMRYYSNESFATIDWYNKHKNAIEKVYQSIIKVLSSRKISALFDGNKKLSDGDLQQSAASDISLSPSDIKISNTAGIGESDSAVDDSSAPGTLADQLEATHLDSRSKAPEVRVSKRKHRHRSGAHRQAGPSEPTPEEKCILADEKQTHAISSEVHDVESTGCTGIVADSVPVSAEIPVESVAPRSGWNYANRVVQWFSDPEEALKRSEYIDKSADKNFADEIIIRHRLPFAIENQFRQFSVDTIERDDRYGGARHQAFNFPGAIEVPGKNIVCGIFKITYNPKDKTVYHRYFHEFTTQQLQSHLDECIASIEFPPLGTSTRFERCEDMTAGQCTIKENALAVHITDKYGVTYILFKGHKILSATA